MKLSYFFILGICLFSVNFIFAQSDNSIQFLGFAESKDEAKSAALSEMNELSLCVDREMDIVMERYSFDQSWICELSANFKEYFSERDTSALNCVVDLSGYGKNTKLAEKNAWELAQKLQRILKKRFVVLGKEYSEKASLDCCSLKILLGKDGRIVLFREIAESKKVAFQNNLDSMKKFAKMLGKLGKEFSILKERDSKENGQFCSEMVVDFGEDSESSLFSSREKGGVVKGGKLGPCPSSPNCVDNQGTGYKTVDSFPYSDDAMDRLKKAISSLEIMTIVEEKGDYLRADVSNWPFTDDLEIYVNHDSKTVYVRSASRVGYYDFGANVKHVEKIREALNKQ